MKTTKIVAFLLAVLMLCSLFAACKKEPEQPDNPTPPNNPGQTGNTPADTELVLVNEGVANYVFVYDYNASGDVVDAVGNIVKAIKTYTGADVEMRECFSDRQDENDVVTEKEILVGMTNREESINVLKNKRSRDWTLQVSGTKLVIGSSSDAGTVKALTQFLNSFVYEQGNKYEVKRYVDSNGKDGKLFSLTFKSSQNQNESGTYSYSLFEIFGARIDSFLIAYAKKDDTSEAVANKLQDYISKQTGFELEVRKDTRAYGDYEILVGPTDRTDAKLMEGLGDDEWLIKLQKTEKGAQMILLYGKNAADSVVSEGFRSKVMPTKKTPEEKSITDEFTYRK